MKRAKEDLTAKEDLMILLSSVIISSGNMYFEVQGNTSRSNYNKDKHLSILKALPDLIHNTDKHLSSILEALPDLIHNKDKHLSSILEALPDLIENEYSVMAESEAPEESDESKDEEMFINRVISNYINKIINDSINIIINDSNCSENADSYNKIFQAFINSNNVKSLTLDLSNETTEHSALLSEIIKYNSTLQSLNIRHLTTLSINSIFQALPVNNSLESLTLEGIKTLSDISSLFASICSNTSLKSLYIHRCNVKDQDLNFIETNSSLKTLSLDEGSNGDGFTFQGLEIMRKWLIQNSTLDTLKFRLNNNVDQKTVLSFIQDANNLLELDITVENYPTTDIYDGNNILELIPLTSSLCYLHLTHIISPGSTASTAYNTRIGSEILSFIHTEDLALYEKIYFAKRLAISPKALDFYREKKDAKTEDVDAISKLASFVAKGLSI